MARRPGGLVGALMRAASIRKQGERLWWLFKVQAGLCHWCKIEMVRGAEFTGLSYQATRDHREPIRLAKGKASAPGNVVAACNWCNQHKKDKSEAQWLAMLPHALAFRRAHLRRKFAHEFMGDAPVGAIGHPSKLSRPASASPSLAALVGGRECLKGQGMQADV